MFRLSSDRIPRILVLKSAGDLFVALVAACLILIALTYDPPALIGAGASRYPAWTLACVALLFAASIVIAMASMGLYDPDLRIGLARVLARTVFSFVLTAAFTAAWVSAFPELSAAAREFSVCILCAFMAVLACKFVQRVYSARTSVRRVVVLGAGARATLVERLRRKRDRRGIDIVGFIDLSESPRKIEASRIIELTEPLPIFVAANRIDELVLAFEDRRGNGAIPTEGILECKAEGISVIDVCSFYERQIGKVHLGSVSAGSIALSDAYSRPLQNSAKKRLLDIVLASLALILTAPLMLAIAVAIWIESKGEGPVLYTQKRLGKNGKPFILLKFRSMEVDAEADGIARWAEVGDDRVTKVGAFLRKTRLDELPQLVNVLKGEMSLVGPRPERPELTGELSEAIPNYRLRLLVRPGITGWAQVRYSYAASIYDAGEKLSYDLYYIKHYSFVFDLAVILQTPQVMLWRKGAR